jgi:phage shock protein A
MIIEIVIGLVVLVAIGAAVSPKFRATLQIWNSKANDAATTPLDRQKNDYDHMVADVTKQVGNVASAKAGAVQADQDAQAAKAELEKLEGQFETFSARLSDGARTELANNIATAEASVKSTAEISEAAHGASDMALKALDGAREKLKVAANQIQSNEQKARVTAVLASAAQVSEELSGINSKIGKFNEANRQVDHDYIAAQERLKMSQGTSTEQELAAMEKQSSADAVIARMNAKIAAKNGTATPATPPAAQ